MELGGKVVKNSSGYALKDLMVGSEGTLGIVTKAILRLLPLPKKALSLLVPFPNLEMAIDTVPRIIKSKAIPTAIEYMVRDVILASEKFLGNEFPDSSADAYLLLTFDGNSSEEIEAAYEKVARICLEAGALDVLISNTQERQESIWKARGAFLEAIKASTTEMDECDVVVPRNRIAEFVKFAERLQDRFDIRIRSFGHAGDGNLHIYVLRDDLPEAAWRGRLGRGVRVHVRQVPGTGREGLGRARHRLRQAALPEGGHGRGRHGAAARHQAGLRSHAGPQPRQGGRIGKAGRVSWESWRSPMAESDTAALAWSGNTLDPDYSRSAELSKPGGEAAIPVSSLPANGGVAGRWNPEDLLAGTLAHCHMLTFLAIAAKARVQVLGYQDQAEATLVTEDRVSRVGEILSSPSSGWRPAPTGPRWRSCSRRPTSTVSSPIPSPPRLPWSPM